MHAMPPRVRSRRTSRRFWSSAPCQPGLRARSRAAKWARRKPARAVGVASAVLFLLVLATMSIVGRALERKERLAEARHQLDQARETVASYRKERFAAEAEETRLARQREEVNNRYFTLEEDRALARLRRSVEERRRRREALFHEVLAALQRAERLDPSLDGTDAVRAELYIEKWKKPAPRGTRPTRRSSDVRPSSWTRGA